MITVWHAVNPTFGMEPFPKWPDDYQEAARVNTNDLDAAYALTNTFDKPWPENEGVQSIGGQQRSTSVGDVLVDSAGRAWRVESAGFSEVGKRVWKGSAPIKESLSEEVAKKLRAVGKQGGWLAGKQAVDAARASLQKAAEAFRQTDDDAGAVIMAAECETAIVAIEDLQGRVDNWQQRG